MFEYLANAYILGSVYFSRQGKYSTSSFCEIDFTAAF